MSTKKNKFIMILIIKATTSRFIACLSSSGNTIESSNLKEAIIFKILVKLEKINNTANNSSE